MRGALPVPLTLEDRAEKTPVLNGYPSSTGVEGDNLAQVLACQAASLLAAGVIIK